MQSQPISLETIYGYLVKMNHRLEVIDHRLESLESRFNTLENRTNRLESKIEDIWETRDKLQLSFSRRVLLGNSFLAGIVAFIVVLITGKYRTSI